MTSCSKKLLHTCANALGSFSMHEQAQTNAICIVRNCKNCLEWTDSKALQTFESIAKKLLNACEFLCKHVQNCETSANTAKHPQIA